MAAKKQKTHVVSDDAYKRALLKKVRIASAVLVELDRRVALGQKARDADVGDTERRHRARGTIASALEKLKALGVRDDECESARAAANAVLEQKLKKRAAREREAAKDAAKRQRRGDGARAMGAVKSDAAWALHAIAKTASGGADARAMDTKEIETRARATAADAERVNLKTCNAALWSIAKIASRVNDENACAQALGKAFEALLRRSAAFSAAETDARAASTTLWAAASTQRTTVGAFTDDGAMRRAVNVAAEALAANADKANAQDAANALWGAAKLRRSLDPACARALIATLTTTPVVTDGTDGVKLEELTIALWAMATFAGDGMRNVRACAAPLMKRAKEATKKPKTWSPQAIANAAWAAGKLATISGDDTEDDATHSEACVKDAKQLVTSLIPAAKLAALTAQGFAHVLAAAAAVDVDARLVGDLAKFTVIGLKTHASTLTSTDLASIVEAVRDLKLCSSMSDGTKLAEDIARAIERGVDTFDWQACGRLDLAIEDVVSAQDVERLRESLSARGKEVCDAVDAKRLDVERGAADALLSLPGDYSALTAPFDANAATMLVVDDRYRLVTKKLRRVGWQTTMWQRFSCGEHAKGASWLERDDGNLEPFATAVVRMPPTKASLDMVLNAVAANVRFGGRVWIYGAAAEGVGAVVTDLPKGMFKDAKLKMLNAEFGVVRCVRTQDAAGKRGKALKSWREKKTLDLSSVIPATKAGKRVKDATMSWTSYPGLFAGGGLDIMTSALLRRFLPTLERKDAPRVLDYCSGNGVIAAATKLIAPKAHVTVLDADACALDACKKNLPDDVERALSDGWTSLAPDAAFDIIVSNPPVHLGVVVDFEITRKLLDAIPTRLTATGAAYLVTQQYVPVRALARDLSSSIDINVVSADGRFVVWKCSRKS